MKKLFWLTITICLLGSCKKAIEDKKADIVLDAMTNGQWYVSSFIEGGSDLTTSFAPYVFQFYRDGKVSGFTSTSEEKGTWAGDPDALTIQSQFPTASDPVKKLNALWKILDSSWDYVKAETTVDGQNKQLQLKKK
ncbi:hypothetical protein ACFSQD_08280 [Flavihumibacter stibioxidans]|uniref:Lipocalin-like domain-containing protein n=1 Tax=Flavihumibacter stibioxidans TaxID=1834163 RepID=A0ABR7M5K6_9BACT|nr:hypothetical protein [Flavihumibacter stibioxidans]MBC6490303.1 hypothetical protein [Flavihumibacter stibioxidans]